MSPNTRPSAAQDLHDGCEQTAKKTITFVPAVPKNIFNFYSGSPSSGGSRGRVRTDLFRRKSMVLGQFWPVSRGYYFDFGPKRS